MIDDTPTREQLQRQKDEAIWRKEKERRAAEAAARHPDALAAAHEARVAKIREKKRATALEMGLARDARRYRFSGLPPSQEVLDWFAELGLTWDDFLADKRRLTDARGGKVARCAAPRQNCAAADALAEAEREHLRWLKQDALRFRANGWSPPQEVLNWLAGMGLSWAAFVADKTLLNDASDGCLTDARLAATTAAPVPGRPIPGFASYYYATRDGQVLDVRRGGNLAKRWNTPHGPRVQFFDLPGEVGSPTFYVAYLVALTWLPRPFWFDVEAQWRRRDAVRHKNGDVTDCAADNLEWARASVAEPRRFTRKTMSPAVAAAMARGA